MTPVANELDTPWGRAMEDALASNTANDVQPSNWYQLAKKLTADSRSTKTESSWKKAITRMRKQNGPKKESEAVMVADALCVPRRQLPPLPPPLSQAELAARLEAIEARVDLQGESLTKSVDALARDVRALKRRIAQSGESSHTGWLSAAGIFSLPLNNCRILRDVSHYGFWVVNEKVATCATNKRWPAVSPVSGESGGPAVGLALADGVLGGLVCAAI